jgi:hypothetical protein
MAIDERRRLEMVERLSEMLGADVADTVLAHLPPHGEQVATAGQIDRLEAAIERLRAETTEQIEQLRVETTRQIEQLRAETTRQTEHLRAETTRQTEHLRAETTRQTEHLRAETTGQIEQLRAEMHHLFDVHGERMAARWRRDLLLISVPQLAVLASIVLSLNT